MWGCYRWWYEGMLLSGKFNKLSFFFWLLWSFIWSSAQIIMTMLLKIDHIDIFVIYYLTVLGPHPKFWSQTLNVFGKFPSLEDRSNNSTIHSSTCKPMDNLNIRKISFQSSVLPLILYFSQMDFITRWVNQCYLSS